MLNVKQNFKIIFIVLVIAQIVILGVVLCMYLINASKIINGIVRHNKMMSMKYRDLFIELLDKKFFLMLEDIALILKAINKDIENGEEYAEYVENEDYKKWYLEKNDDLKNNYGFYRKGSPPLRLSSLITNLIQDLFLKYQKWKDQNYVNIELMSIKNNGNLLYKYPLKKKRQK